MVLWRKLFACDLRVKLRLRESSISFQVNRFESFQLVQQNSSMADQKEHLTFNSRSKPPYDKFSNFYKAKIEMPEGVFGSVEHYFQAMKFIDKNHARFEINGDLGKRKIESNSWKETVSRGRFIKSAGGKSGTEKYKLTLRRNGLDRERAKQKMKEGLRKKFEGEPFKGLLLKTGARELVHTPMRGKTDYWTGRVDKKSGNVTGENNMGKLLMEIRQELGREEKSSPNKENKDAVEDRGESVVDKDITDETCEETNDSSRHEGQKRKREDDNVQVKDQHEGQKRKREDDNVQVKDQHEGPNIKRKKIEKKSKDEKKGDEEVKVDDENKRGDERKGDNEDTTRGTQDCLGSEGKKRKHGDDDVQVQDNDKHEGLKVKRMKKNRKTKKIKMKVRAGAASKDDEKQATSEAKKSLGCEDKETKHEDDNVQK